MKNYHKLNLNFSPLISTFEFPDNNGVEQIKSIDIANASEELLAWANSLNMTLFKIILFTLPPSYENQEIHLDGTYEHHLNYVVNWSYNVENTKMHWYKELRTGNTIDNRFNGKFTTWRPEEVEIIDSLEILNNDPILVNAGIPHNVINLGNTTRHCISVRFEPRGLSWEQAQEKFKSWFRE